MNKALTSILVTATLMISVGCSTVPQPSFVDVALHDTLPIAVEQSTTELTSLDKIEAIALAASRIQAVYRELGSLPEDNGARVIWLQELFVLLAKDQTLFEQVMKLVQGTTFP